MSLVLTDTPIEEYSIDGLPVYVKREDLCCPYPGPGFSKVRGLAAHLRTSLIHGVLDFGVLDTSTSKAGWGTAYLGRAVGVTVTVYYPAKQEPATLLPSQRMAKALGARVVRIDPVARAKILWNQLNKEWKSRPQAELLPLGLRLPEAVRETADEFCRTANEYKTGTIVVNVSSGTICSGLLVGLIEADLIPHTLVAVTSHRMKAQVKTAAIWDKVTDCLGFAARRPPPWFRLVVSDCEYSDACEEPCPFPCNPRYDRKAWQWLTYNRKGLAEPVLFWNIGS